MKTYPRFVLAFGKAVGHEYGFFPIHKEKGDHDGPVIKGLRISGPKTGFEPIK
jgi:hypothetical protein